jgi:hypothetical protein
MRMASHNLLEPATACQTTLTLSCIVIHPWFARLFVCFVNTGLMEKLSFQHKAKELQFNYWKRNGMMLDLDNPSSKGISFKSTEETRERV